MGKARKAKVFLTDRAIRDLQEIESYTIGKWGEKQAEKYPVCIRSILYFGRVGTWHPFADPSFRFPFDTQRRIAHCCVYSLE